MELIVYIFAVIGVICVFVPLAILALFLSFEGRLTRTIDPGDACICPTCGGYIYDDGTTP